MEQEGLEYPFSIIQYFVPEFIVRMRRHRDIKEKPSPRQAFAICKLLLPPFMRKGKLTFGDIVSIAKFTTKVDDQDIAQQIAMDVLLNPEDSDKEMPPLNLEDSFMSLLSDKNDEPGLIFEPTAQQIESLSQYHPSRDSKVDIFQQYTNKPDMGVGPGEDELIKMVIRENKDKRDERTRRILAEFLKVKLLKLGLNMERSNEMMKRPILRPYQLGDDTDDIDEERSLENIFDQGKSIEQVTHDDFLIRKKNRKKKSIVFILDISNTMFYQNEGLTSIHYSIMSLVPLLWSFRNEKYGLIFYESSSHIQKEIEDEMNVDRFIDNMLFLVTSTTSDVEKAMRGGHGSHTWGGTVPNKSLEWAFDQFDLVSERTDKICFYFSDYVLKDPDENTVRQSEIFTTINRMIDRGIHVVACVSPVAKSEIFHPYTKDVLASIAETGARMIETYRPSDFLEEIQKFLTEL